jgi:hypothetical protein
MTIQNLAEGSFLLAESAAFSSVFSLPLFSQLFCHMQYAKLYFLWFSLLAQNPSDDNSLSSKI